MWLCAFGFTMPAFHAAAQSGGGELLLATKRVGDETFAAAKAAFGEQGITEILFTLGYHSLVSMMLNVDEHPLPAGVEPELPPLAN